MRFISDQGSCRKLERTRFGNWLDLGERVETENKATHLHSGSDERVDGTREDLPEAYDRPE